MTACGSSGDDTSGGNAANFDPNASGTLNAWGFNNADDVGKARLDYATKQLGAVKIQMDQTGFDAQKFTTRLASDNVPDVVQMDREYVATYAAQGLIQPLDKCFTANKVDPKQRWYPAVVRDVTYKNQVWAVPQFYQPPAIILNKTVMDAAGVQDADIDTSNPDKLLAAIAKMYKASGDVPATLGFDPQATGQVYLWTVGMGGKLVGDNGAPTLDDPSNVYGLELLKKITDAQGGFAKYKSFTDSFDTFGEKNQFVRNQVGAQVDAQWYPNVLSPYKDKVKLAAVRSRARTASRSRWRRERPSSSRPRPRTPAPAASGRWRSPRTDRGTRPPPPARRRCSRRTPSTPACSPARPARTRPSATGTSSRPATPASTR